jgi:hypothetical protein
MLELPTLSRTPTQGPRKTARLGTNNFNKIGVRLWT